MGYHYTTHHVQFNSPPNCSLRFGRSWVDLGQTLVIFEPTLASKHHNDIRATNKIQKNTENQVYTLDHHMPLTLYQFPQYSALNEFSTFLTVWEQPARRVSNIAKRMEDLSSVQDNTLAWHPPSSLNWSCYLIFNKSFRFISFGMQGEEQKTLANVGRNIT